MGKRVLLDENLTNKLRFLLPGHVVVSALYQGWAGKLNGELVTLAEAAAFDVMITADQGISYQQNMKERKIALVVLSVNREKTVLANAPRILAAIDAATVGSYTFIDCR
jgi:hypothetical protein